MRYINLRLLTYLLTYLLIERINSVTCGRRAAVLMSQEYTEVSEASRGHTHRTPRPAVAVTQAVDLASQHAVLDHYSPIHSQCPAPLTYTHISLENTQIVQTSDKTIETKQSEIINYS